MGQPCSVPADPAPVASFIFETDRRICRSTWHCGKKGGEWRSGNYPPLPRGEMTSTAQRSRYSCQPDMQIIFLAGLTPPQTRQDFNSASFLNRRTECKSGQIVPPSSSAFPSVLDTAPLTIDALFSRYLGGGGRLINVCKKTTILTRDTRLAKCCTYVLVSDLINESDRLLRLCNGPPLFHLLYEGHSLFSSLEGNMKKNN